MSDQQLRQLERIYASDPTHENYQRLQREKQRSGQSEYFLTVNGDFTYLHCESVRTTTSTSFIELMHYNIPDSGHYYLHMAATWGGLGGKGSYEFSLATNIDGVIDSLTGVMCYQRDESFTNSASGFATGAFEANTQIGVYARVVAGGTLRAEDIRLMIHKLG